MTGVACSVVRWIADEPQPGLVEAELVDAAGRRWIFVDKAPVFCDADVSAASAWPMEGTIRCQVLSTDVDEHAHEVVIIDTAKPDGLDSGGVTTFSVAVASLT